jgi:hypothetical protein
LTKELAGKPIKEAPEDQTLPLCWYGKRPFRSVYEVRKYFKPIALSFPSSGRMKAQFEIPPEAYLIVSVSQVPINQFLKESRLFFLLL